MVYHWTGRTVAVGALAWLFLTTAMATTVGALNIVNAGFEEPFLLDGEDNRSSGWTVPGWSEGDELYSWAWFIYNPDATVTAAHGGENVLRSLAYRPATQYLEQQLSDTYQPNTRYTLSAWVADPDAKSSLNTARLMLFAGSTLLGSTEIQPQAADTWTKRSVVIQAVADLPQVGQFLKIRFMWGSNASYQVFVDDVSLTAAPAAAPIAASPVGEWEIAISGNDKGTAFLL